MHLESHEEVLAYVTGGDTGLKKMAKLKNVVSGIDWLLKNNAVTSELTRDQLMMVRRQLNQEIIMVDYGL